MAMHYGHSLCPLTMAMHYAHSPYNNESINESNNESINSSLTMHHYQYPGRLRPVDLRKIRVDPLELRNHRGPIKTNTKRETNQAANMLGERQTCSELCVVAAYEFRPMRCTKPTFVDQYVLELEPLCL
jgi:hypothetical protein